MQRERNTVVDMRSGLYHFSGILNLLSSHSTIFMAGKAINISITTEKASVMVICSMSIIRKIVVQNQALLLFEEVVLLAEHRYCLK